MAKRGFGAVPTDGGVVDLFGGDVVSNGAQQGVDTVDVGVVVVGGMERWRAVVGAVQNTVAVDEQSTGSTEKVLGGAHGCCWCHVIGGCAR